MFWQILKYCTGAAIVSAMGAGCTARQEHVTPSLSAVTAMPRLAAGPGITRFGLYTFDLSAGRLSYAFPRSPAEPLHNCSDSSYACVDSATFSFSFPKTCSALRALEVGSRWTHNGETMEVLDVRTDALPMHSADWNGVYFQNIDVPAVVYRIQFRTLGSMGGGLLDKIYVDLPERLAQHNALPFRELARRRILSSWQFVLSGPGSFGSIHSHHELPDPDLTFFCQDDATPAAAAPPRTEPPLPSPGG